MQVLCMDNVTKQASTRFSIVKRGSWQLRNLDAEVKVLYQENEKDIIGQ